MPVHCKSNIANQDRRAEEKTGRLEAMEAEYNKRYIDELVSCPKHLATSLPRLWARFIAAKPRHKPIMAAFCGFKSHPNPRQLLRNLFRTEH
jgi:hypothetical protein